MYATTKSRAVVRTSAQPAMNSEFIGRGAAESDGSKETGMAMGNKDKIKLDKMRQKRLFFTLKSCICATCRKARHGRSTQTCVEMDSMYVITISSKHTRMDLSGT